jgi:MoaA/NifB/PqqE/SkfB family radical SAM enzyme
MSSRSTTWAEVDDQGRLMLPEDLVAQYGLQAGARLRIDAGENGLRLHRPVTHLAKVYVEPTNRCNIVCRTCMRNVWEVEYGRMASDTFDNILEGLSNISPPPSVFFGGLGEPLAHPKIIEMIKQVKELDTNVELITNGTLLDEQLSRQLVASGLDILWVSIDGARPESYADVRLGAVLPDVIDNMVTLRNARPYAYIPKPEIGIVFVAMKQNIADLPDVLAIGRHVRATRILVTNLLPYTPELISETLYEKTLKDVTYMSSPWLRRLSLPKMFVHSLKVVQWRLGGMVI